MKPRTRRALWIAAGVAGLGVATTLVLNAFQSNLVFFFSPTQVAAIRKQLLAANTRLVAIERERRELKERIAALAAQLKRDER